MLFDRLRNSANRSKKQSSTSSAQSVPSIQSESAKRVSFSSPKPVLSSQKQSLSSESSQDPRTPVAGSESMQVLNQQPAVDEDTTNIVFNIISMFPIFITLMLLLISLINTSIFSSFISYFVADLNILLCTILAYIIRK